MVLTYQMQYIFWSEFNNQNSGETAITDRGQTEITMMQQTCYEFVVRQQNQKNFKKLKC